MKLFRKALRYWIAFASLLSFLGGWVILAHSPKPVQPVIVQSITLPAIQPFDGNVNTNAPGFFSDNSQSIPQSRSSMPSLRTRGS
jgi:hypothetical protein